MLCKKCMFYTHTPISKAVAIIVRHERVSWTIFNGTNRYGAEQILNFFETTQLLINLVQVSFAMSTAPFPDFGFFNSTLFQMKYYAAIGIMFLISFANHFGRIGSVLLQVSVRISASLTQNKRGWSYLRFYHWYNWSTLWGAMTLSIMTLTIFCITDTK